MKYALNIMIDVKNAGVSEDTPDEEKRQILLDSIEKDIAYMREWPWILGVELDWADSPSGMTDTNSDCPHGLKGPWRTRACGCRLLLIPFSEVAMHMRVADSIMWGQARPHGMCQLYRITGEKFSSPITVGEAGYNMAQPDKLT